MPRRHPIVPLLITLAAAGLLITIFTSLVAHLRDDLGAQIHQKMIDRAAAVLHPAVLQELAGLAPTGVADFSIPGDTVSAILATGQQQGMLSVEVFDGDGRLIRSVPSALLFADLPIDDYLALTALRPISRYHEEFSVDDGLIGVGGAVGDSPVLEILLPLPHPGGAKLAGVVRYHLDARPLAGELRQLDEKMAEQTRGTLLGGSALILLVFAGAYVGLRRAQLALEERNARLLRANFELTLSAKASALGQITSHLIHGLQGPVAGLRAMVAANHGPAADTDWQQAAEYTERLQSLIAETIGVLSDRTTLTTYEISADDLAATVRERHQGAAATRAITLAVHATFPGQLNSVRASLLGLIINNLVDNALAVSHATDTITVHLAGDLRMLEATISDQGPGIPAALQPHLFEPGRSSRPGGSGLGLALCQLIARQLQGEVRLASTGPDGSRFQVRIPRLDGAPVSPAD